MYGRLREEQDRAQQVLPPDLIPVQSPMQTDVPLLSLSLLSMQDLRVQQLSLRQTFPALAEATDRLLSLLRAEQGLTLMHGHRQGEPLQPQHQGRPEHILLRLPMQTDVLPSQQSQLLSRLFLLQPSRMLTYYVTGEQEPPRWWPREELRLTPIHGLPRAEQAQQQLLSLRELTRAPSPMPTVVPQHKLSLSPSPQHSLPPSRR